MNLSKAIQIHKEALIDTVNAGGTTILSKIIILIHNNEDYISSFIQSDEKRFDNVFELGVKTGKKLFKADMITFSTEYYFKKTSDPIKGSLVNDPDAEEGVMIVGQTCDGKSELIELKLINESGKLELKEQQHFKDNKIRSDLIRNFYLGYLKGANSALEEWR